MTAALFTRIRNPDGPLVKAFTLKDGRLHKAAAADLADGMAHRMAIDSVAGLAEAVGNLHSNEALTFGIPAANKIRIVTQKALARGVKNAVCRDRAHFAWPKGRAVLMLDLDRPRDVSAPLRAREFDAMLCGLLPWWSGAARLYRPSASAFVYDEAGNELSGPGSLRAYAIIDKGENIPFVGLAITDALWKAGHGRIEFSAAGSMLVRCPVDGAVWQPERLDFAGPSILGAGLVQKRYPPLIFAGSTIDSEAAIVGGPGKVTFPVWQSNSKEVRLAKYAARPEETKRRKRYVEERVATEVAAGADVKAARRKWIAAVSTGTLHGDFRLYFRDGGSVTVADVLANPRRFDKDRCADPLDPNYASDSRIAQFYANAAPRRPHIFSHAHGGSKYALTAGRAVP